MGEYFVALWKKCKVRARRPFRKELVENEPFSNQFMLLIIIAVTYLMMVAGSFQLGFLFVFIFFLVLITECISLWAYSAKHTTRKTTIEELGQIKSKAKKQICVFLREANIVENDLIRVYYYVYTYRQKREEDKKFFIERAFDFFISGCLFTIISVFISNISPKCGVNLMTLVIPALVGGASVIAAFAAGHLWDTIDDFRRAPLSYAITMNTYLEYYLFRIIR